RTMSKVEWGESTMWNAAVDEYIASGVDHRTPEAIKNAAKIGQAGGRFRRECEAFGCENMESKSLKPFSHCSGCKTAVSYSHICQKEAWKAHKSACRAGRVRAQMLPSQGA
ncbi:hypothetical protein DFH07DRAFT_702930, partial [Mycena maculata]